MEFQQYLWTRGIIPNSTMHTAKAFLDIRKTRLRISSTLSMYIIKIKCFRYSIRFQTVLTLPVLGPDYCLRVSSLYLPFAFRHTSDAECRWAAADNLCQITCLLLARHIKQVAAIISTDFDDSDWELFSQIEVYYEFIPDYAPSALQ